MDKLVIEGGRPLKGIIKVSGAKNAALPIFAATLLAPGAHVIRNVPDLRDIRTVIKLIEALGVKVERIGESSYKVDTGGPIGHEAPYELVKTMRASFMVAGPLLARLGRARVSQPGGCAIGVRPVDQHLKGFEALGAKIGVSHGYVEADAAGGLRGGRVTMDIVTVTGVMNVMMAACLAKGRTVIENAAREPEVAALADFLNSMGARVQGAGTATVTIDGVDSLAPAEAAVIPDRIEAGTFMAAAAITGGDVTIRGAEPERLSAVIGKLSEAGVDISIGGGHIRVRGGGVIKPVSVTTAPYPGFPTDMQAQFMALMSLADGASVIKETIFENRFMHVAELRRMGADIKVDGAAAMVRGVRSLTGAAVMATDLRASASLVLAGLAAEGVTEVLRIYHLDRGYESIEKKLSVLGASIRREPDGY